MSLTYPFVIPIPGQIAFSAVIVSNLLIAASCERETERVRDTLGSRGNLHLVGRLADGPDQRGCTEYWNRSLWIHMR